MAAPPSNAAIDLTLSDDEAAEIRTPTQVAACQKTGRRLSGQENKAGGTTSTSSTTTAKKARRSSIGNSFRPTVRKRNLGGNTVATPSTPVAVAASSSSLTTTTAGAAGKSAQTHDHHPSSAVTKGRRKTSSTTSSSREGGAAATTMSAVAAPKSKKRGRFSATSSSSSSASFVDIDDDSSDDGSMVRRIDAEKKSAKMGQNVDKSTNKKTTKNQHPESIPTSVLFAKQENVPPIDSSSTVAAMKRSDPEHADDNDDDDDDLSLDTDRDLPSLNFLQNHCWSCKIELNLPPHLRKHLKSTEGDDQVICCALHEHPILQVPVCSVCSEKVVDAEVIVAERGSSDGDNNDNSDMDEDEDGVCCACGVIQFEEADGVKFFLCDSCPRSMCEDCLAQAHGSKHKVHQIELDEGKWECGHCAPPNFLRRLQQRQALVANVDTKELDESTTSPAQSSRPRRDMETILTELHVAESKKHELERQLDDPDQKRDEIRQDMQGFAATEADQTDGKAFSEGDVDYALAVWIEDRKRHLRRVEDFIVGLQEELETGYNLDVKTVYQSAADNETFGNENFDGNDDRDDGPAWKRQADRVIQKREEEADAEYNRIESRKRKKRKEEKKAGIESSPPNPNHNIDITDLDEIEDLGWLDEDSAVEERYADWTGKQRVRYDEDLLEQAQEAEDALLQEHKSVKVRTVLHSTDESATKKEAYETSRGHIRRDEKVQLKRRLENAKEAPKYRRKLSSGKHSKNSSGKHSTTVCVAAAKSAVQVGNSAGRSASQENTPRAPQKDAPCTQSRDPIVLDNDSDVDDFSTKRGRRSNSMFQSSTLVLSTDPYIAVASGLGEKLKEHQKEAVKFMFENSFADLSSLTGDKAPGGCILAHSMGLGKSLSCVALLHALMQQPSLEDSTMQRSKIHKVLLVVPVNTIANWENEFNKWTSNLKYRPSVVNLGDANHKISRLKFIERWDERGGILLTTESIFKNIISEEEAKGPLCSPGPDALVIDEAHLMLSKDNKISRALSKVSTPRRICLTGSPFQNDFLEFFRFVSFVRPGVLGDSEKTFQRTHADPIQGAMASNAPDNEKSRADELLQELIYKTTFFIHRRDPSVLRQDLPPLTHICLHVRPTKVQRALTARYAKLRKSEDAAYNNFLKQYTHMRAVTNHPGALLMKGKGGNNDGPDQLELKMNGCNSPTVDEIVDIFGDDSEVEVDDDQDAVNEDGTVSEAWWKKTAQKIGINKFREVESGNKMIVLLHILAFASQNGEKTIVFSQCLKTLDYISSILSTPNWEKSVPSLHEAFPGLRAIGGWRKDVDFVRIDGAVDGVSRGELIKNFDQDDTIKCFLLSSKAGGIGINLVSANRCVIFDSSFNPTVDLQSLFRCYRFGQTRSVYAYRLLTEGSMEERVYSRAVNKTGLANRVIDNADLRRRFTEAEIGLLSKDYEWVGCDRCDKWRMLPPDANLILSTLPEKMYCENLNMYDQRLHWNCAVKEKSQAWYVDHYSKPNVPLDEADAMLASPSLATASGLELEKLAKEDKILQNLLTITAKDVPIVQKQYCHDVLNQQSNETNSSPSWKNAGSSSLLKAGGGAKRKLIFGTGSQGALNNSKNSKAILAQAENDNTESQQTHLSSSSTETEVTTSFASQTRIQGKQKKRVQPQQLIKVEKCST